MNRLQYWRRLFASYVFSKSNQLTFWHGEPAFNEQADYGQLGQYYMPFKYKAEYPGPFDENGVPQLDYHGTIGLQYNPIAVTQFALGHYNLYVQTKEDIHLTHFRNQIVWLLDHLEKNPYDIIVWKHQFNFDYKELLESGWYSGLAQAQGLSALVRAKNIVKDNRLDEAIEKVWQSLSTLIDKGGVSYRDENDNLWIEEYILSPPTHIINGFIWALWGVYDLWLMKKETVVKAYFDECVETIKTNLPKYDSGYWSLYELSDNRMQMLASPFYHKLHIIQLKILHRMTGDEYFFKLAEKWSGYSQSKINRYRSLINKSIFKLLYY